MINIDDFLGIFDKQLTILRGERLESVRLCMKTRQISSCERCLRYKNGDHIHIRANCPYEIGIKYQSPKRKGAYQ